MKKTLIFLACLFFMCADCKHYELAVCTIFRDDVKWLPEWIEFHKKQGVQHFYLYDNLSSDNPKEVLSKYIKRGLVTLIDWPYESTGQDFFTIQCNAYMDCANAHKKDVMWMAFLDTDEFLFCPEKTNLVKFLNVYINYGAVSAYWMMYGTSNVNIPKNGKMLDHLLYRAKNDYFAHKIMKTIAQPRYIVNIPSPHEVTLKNRVCVQMELNNLRINHYWSRDVDFFHNVKLPRREKWYHDTEMQIKMESEMNEVYDPILGEF